jgi:integrase
MLRTKSGLPKYVSRFKDRNGKDRFRFRKGGIVAYIHGTPWSEEFMRQYATLLDQTAPVATVNGRRTKAGTLDALVVSYYRSPEFRALKPSTQHHRRRILDRFCPEYGDLLVKGLRRDHVRRIVADKAERTPEAANNLVKVLRVVLKYAISIDMIDANPATGIRRYRSHGEGFPTWTKDDIAKFEAKFAIGTRPRLALGLLLFTAQRVSDVALMGWQQVSSNGNAIKVQQQKTGKKLELPLHPDLKAMLVAAPRTNLRFLMTERGAPFTAKSLGDCFKKQCRIAGLPDRSAHGLRKAAATHLANKGCNPSQIAAFTGHKSLKEVAHYTAAADQASLARQALTILIGPEGERELSNPRIRSV